MKGTVTVGDTPIYYEKTGEHPQWLLLHGNSENMHIFDEFVSFLPKDLPLLLADSPGHGASRWNGKPLLVRQMAADLLALLDKLGIEKISILGFSDGGNIAMVMALLAPQRVEKLVLCGANLYPEGLLEEVRREDAAYMEKLLQNPEPTMGYARKLALMNLMTVQPDLTEEEAAAISCPTLVMAGDRDVIAPEHTKRIAASIPNAQLYIFENCDHFVFKHRPKEAAQQVLDFHNGQC